MFILIVFLLLTAVVVMGLIASGKNDPAGVFISAVLAGCLMFILGMSVGEKTAQGLPLEHILPGNYQVVGLIEVSKDKQTYYQMILEQEGKVKLYTLPKNMIVAEEGAQEFTTIGVVAEAGLIKATLRGPRGVGPFP